MKRTRSLTAILEDQTAILNDGERLPVEFDNGAYAKPDGTVVVAPNVRDFIGRDLSGPDELRVIRDTLSHEVEHVRESVLTGKQEFAEEYGRYGKVAGTVLNIVEDAYIDRNRLRRFRGLRRTHAFVIDSIMQNHHRRPRIDSLERPGALIEGLLQVSVSGGAKGISGVDPEVQKFLAESKLQIDRARTSPSWEDREDIAREITDALIDLLPSLDDDELDELEVIINEMPTDDAPEATNDFDPKGEQEADEEPGDEGDDAPAPGEEGEGSGSSPTPDDLGDEVDEDGAGGTGVADDGDAEADSQGDASESGDAGDGEETDDESGDDTDADSDGGSGLSDEELAELEELAEKMEEQARKSGDWYDAGEGYDEADDADIMRYEQLQEAVAKERNDIGKQKRDRDAKAEEVRCHSWKTHEKVRDRMDSGLAAEIEAAFRALKTQDHEFSAEQGDDLNLDGYIRHEAGDFMETEFYYDVERAAVGDRAVGVSVDMSSSMDELAAKTALAALATATGAIGDTFTASAYYSVGSGWRTGGNPKTTLITAPDEEFDYKTLDAIKADGWTPTATGIVHVHGLLDEASAREKVLIVVTDGDANVSLDGYDEGGREDAQRVANAARAEGIKVIGLGVGRSVTADAMAETFGPNGYVMASMDQLTSALIEVYRAQLGLDEGY